VAHDASRGEKDRVTRARRGIPPFAIVAVHLVACADDAPSLQRPSIDAGREAASPGAGGRESGVHSTGGGGQKVEAGSGGQSVRSDAAADADARARDGADASTPADATTEADTGTEASTPTFAAYPPVSYPPENPASAAKALLGQVLFWDEQLSSDDSTACGTCHRGSAGGSDPRAGTLLHPGLDGLPASTDDIHGAIGIRRCRIVAGTVSYVADPVFGLGPQVTRRKPPSYLDAMFFPTLFWDGRAAGAFTDPDTGSVLIASGGALESQSVGPPLGDAEMACEARTWADVHAKLRAAVPLVLARNVPTDLQAFIAGRSYPELFAAAFGSQAKVDATEPDDIINTRRIAFAIATHERRLTSDHTPWDRWNTGETNALTEAQRRGFTVFMGAGRCQVCHSPPMFTNNAFHNLGFEPAVFDTGRQSVTSSETDRGAFKTPTLRNVGLRESGGLLHDGSGHSRTLETVVAAYDLPPNADSNTDPLIVILGLSGTQSADLVDFLRNGLTDPRVRDETAPFDRPTLRSEP
jgi:cytochrome c peroxidase